VNISVFYYSGAGNTNYIAKKVTAQLKALKHNVNLVKITNSSILEINMSDAYIVGFPVYDLSSPQLVKDLIVNINDTNKSIAYFCTKAFASGESIKELSMLSDKKEMQTVAIMELYMPGTDALIFFAKPNSFLEKTLKFFHSRNIDKKIKLFISKLLENKTTTLKQKWYFNVSFLIPQKTKDKFHAQYTKYIPEFYSQTDICIECMKCVKECPRENIKFEEYIKFEVNCDMCLHCVHHCPTESIQIGSFTQGHVRYKKIEIR